MKKKGQRPHQNKISFHKFSSIFRWMSPLMEFKFIIQITIESLFTDTAQCYVYPVRMYTTYSKCFIHYTLQWRHNRRDSVWNHQLHDCFLKRLFRHRSKKTSKLRFTGLCEGNSPEAGEFPAQKASNAENVSIWWRHHAKFHSFLCNKFYPLRPGDTNMR